MGLNWVLSASAGSRSDRRYVLSDAIQRPKLSPFRDLCTGASVLWRGTNKVAAVITKHITDWKHLFIAALTRDRASSK